MFNVLHQLYVILNYPNSIGVKAGVDRAIKNRSGIGGRRRKYLHLNYCREDSCPE